MGEVSDLDNYTICDVDSSCFRGTNYLDKLGINGDIRVGDREYARNGRSG